MKYQLQHDLDPNDDQEYCDIIEEFLRGDNKVAYSYLYPRNKKDLARQVPYAAPLNDKGHKPVYIEMFSKLSTAWDMHEIEKA